MKRLSTWVWFGLLVLAAILIVPRLGQQSSGPTTPGAAKALDFTLPLSGGKGQMVLSNYQGKVVLLDFWATWCPPCKDEIPHFVRLQGQYADKDFHILGVALDKDGDQAVVPFARQFAINYPLALDDGSVAEQYRVRSIPTTVLIDKQGYVVKRYVGFVPPETFEKDISALL